MQHTDTAPVLAKVVEELDGIRSAGVPRRHICLVIKICDQKWHTRVAESLYKSSEPMGNEQVDLYLVHLAYSTDLDDIMK